MRLQIVVLGRDTDTTFHVHIKTTDTVADLKNAIAATSPQYEDVDKLHLFYDGVELQSADRVVSVNAGFMREDSVILLSYRARDTTTRSSCGAHLSIAGATFWPAELVEALDKVVAGFKAGFEPRLSAEGESGTYFMSAAKPVADDAHFDDDGDKADAANVSEYVACFKPRDEEPNAPNNPKRSVGRLGSPSARIGILSGEAYMREVIAYMLDHEGLAGVPPTGLVAGWHKRFVNAPKRVDMSARQRSSSSLSMQSSASSSSPHMRGQSEELLADSMLALPDAAADSKHLLPKIGSFQLFVPDASCSSDFGYKNFPVEEVQKIALLDIRLLNLDRNGENILLRRVFKKRTDPEAAKLPAHKRVQLVYELVPIDHGMILPSDLGVATCDWVWMDWPQVKEPICDKFKEYVRRLDVEKDIAKLKAAFGAKLRPQCITTLRITHAVLKHGVELGWSLHQIGSILSRPAEDMTQKSVVERFLVMATMWATANNHNARTRELHTHSLTVSHHELSERKDAKPVLHSADSTPSFPASMLTDDKPVLRGYSAPEVHSKPEHTSRWWPRAVIDASSDTHAPPLIGGCKPMAISAVRAASAKMKVRIPARHISDISDILPINTHANIFGRLDEIAVAIGCVSEAVVADGTSSNPRSASIEASYSLRVAAETSDAPLLKDLDASKRPHKHGRTWQPYFGMPAHFSAVSAIAVSVSWQSSVLCVTSVPRTTAKIIEGTDNIIHAITATLVAALSIAASHMQDPSKEVHLQGQLASAQSVCNAINAAANTAQAASDVPPKIVTQKLTDAFVTPSPYLRKATSFTTLNSREEECMDVSAPFLALKLSKTLTEGPVSEPARDTGFKRHDLLFCVGGPDLLVDSEVLEDPDSKALSASQLSELAQFVDAYGTHVGAHALRMPTASTVLSSGDDWSRLSARPMRVFGAVIDVPREISFRVEDTAQDVIKTSISIRTELPASLGHAPIDSPVFAIQCGTPTSESPTPPASSRESPLMNDSKQLVSAPISSLKRVGKLDGPPVMNGVAEPTKGAGLSVENLRKIAMRKNADLPPPPPMGMLRISSYSAAMSRLHDLDQRKQRHGAVPDTAGTLLPPSGASWASMPLPAAPSNVVALRRLASTGAEMPTSSSVTDLVKLGHDLPAPLSTTSLASPEGKSQADGSITRSHAPLPPTEGSTDDQVFQYFRRLLESNYPKHKHSSSGMVLPSTIAV